MGNKSNATGLRLGINKNWQSIWYQPKSSYADTLLQDMQIRKMVYLDLKNAAVAGITIKRAMNKITMELRVARPGVVIGKGGVGIELLQQKLNKLTKTRVEIRVFEVKHPELEARLVAEGIGNQCERRIAPRQAARRAVQAVETSGVAQGIMVQISGRIRGAEIARTEKVVWGKVPRHTLRANIDYAFIEVNVPGAGRHGIKVWINKGEKLGYEMAD